jgi:two-component system NarL family response regulator
MELSDGHPRVLIADGQHFFREGLRGTLEAAGMTVVGETADDAEAVVLAGSLEPEVIVIDVNMTNASGTQTLRRIAAASPEARLVVLTVSADETCVLDALACGASSYLLKSTHVDELVGGIRQTARGQAVLSQDALGALVTRVHKSAGATRLEPQQRQPLLTTRELDVLRLMVDGADNAAIGLELSISRHTVKQHVTNIFEKLGVHTRVEAAVYAVRSGLV